MPRYSSVDVVDSSVIAANGRIVGGLIVEPLGVGSKNCAWMLLNDPFQLLQIFLSLLFFLLQVTQTERTIYRLPLLLDLSLLREPWSLGAEGELDWLL